VARVSDYTVEPESGQEMLDGEVREALPAGPKHSRELAEVEMIILFGSHARGDWVEDPENGYFSDFDLLVLVQTEGMANSDKLWSRARDRAQNLTGDVPVSIVVHTVKDVNQKLERGQCPHARQRWTRVDIICWLTAVQWRAMIQ
jgi:predicted nucleotidyltransferase